MTGGLRFPDGFLWGTATSAHQVEGGPAGNDWSVWERTPGRIRDGSSARVACDWWNRAGEDFALAAGLGTNALRFSVEWSRVEPEEGRFDDEALARYRGWAERLRSLGLEPVVCLHHFTLPRWLSARGGFERSSAVDRFARFADRVAETMAGLVRWWITVNEPMVYVALGWFQGAWPPGKRSLPDALRVARNLVRAHGAAHRLLHRRIPDAMVSAGHHVASFVPADPRSALDRGVAALRERLLDRVWLEATLDGRMRLPLGALEKVEDAEDSSDYLGFQHYFTYPVAFSLAHAGNLFAREAHRPREGAPPFMGEFRPEGLGAWARDLRRYGKPLVVTENGLLENEERERPAWLVRTLASLHDAIREGADVRGYLHWSLLDNFEWAEGLGARFGLVHVDFATQARTVKESGRLYGEIARANGVPARLVPPAASR
jgi:beta-glucosidase